MCLKLPLNKVIELQAHSFYIDLDESLNIVELSKAFIKVVPTLCVGEGLAKYFSLQNPPLPIAPNFLEMFDGQLLTIKPISSPEIIFGGSFNKTSTGYLFIGYPQLTEMNQLANMGLSLSDFVSHDPINFYVGTLQLKDSMYKDLIKLNAELKRGKDQLEELVAQRTKELLQSEKMASLGTLAAGVAHEINNPMGFILSNLESLQGYMKDIKPILDALQTLPDSDKSKLNALVPAGIDWSELAYISGDIEPIVSECIKGGKRVSKTVAGLKSFSHPSDTHLHRLNIKEALDLAISLTMNELKHHGELRYVPGEDIFIKGNLTELSQVFVNLLVNASQALTINGLIEIEVEKQSLHVLVHVRDNGHGISQKNLNKLFQPFFTTKAVGSGTGLGLAISHGIVENHGGKISVQSEIDQGTCFTVTLPLDIEI